MHNLDNIAESIESFRNKRNWKQFHTPKNLASSISIEAAELLEHFQWLSDQESKELDEEKKKEIALEIADVAIFLMYLCNELGISLEDSINKKITINEERYPVDKSKGSATKYTKL